MVAEVVHSGHAGSHSDGVMGLGRGLFNRDDGIIAVLAPWEQEEGGWQKWVREPAQVGWRI